MAPSSFAGTPTSSSSITWIWTDNSSDETGFKLFDSSNNLITTIATANTTNYTEGGLNAATNYSRYLVAYTAAGYSTATSTVMVSTDAGSVGDSGGGGGGGGGGGNEEPAPTPKPAGKVTITISSTDRAAVDFILNQQVPAIVARLFQEVFGRPLTPAESTYWKGRARSDKATETKLKGAMVWHKANGSTGIPSSSLVTTSTTTPTVTTIIPNQQVPHVVEQLFSHVFRVRITAALSTYWKNRARTDKRTESLLEGAMRWYYNEGVTSVPGSN